MGAKDESILQIIVGALTQERLDKIVRNNVRYREIEKIMAQTSARLQGGLSKEQYRIVEDYTGLQSSATILYAELAYEQAVHDMYCLFRELGSERRNKEAKSDERKRV